MAFADILAHAFKFVSALVVGGVCVVALWSLDWFLLRRHDADIVDSKLLRQLALLAATLVSVLLLVLTLPVSEETRGGLLSLIGLVVSAVFAMSSTTFVANAMAGLMLRSVGSFRPGDFIRVGESFGRVTERGLFHTEIQTEDRDLTTLPNLHLVSNPLVVVRASGTYVSANVSLGYDVARKEVEGALLEAVAGAELAEGFVYIVDLNDYSVSYKAAGFLDDPKQLLTARSRLRASMLDALHGAGIEILSPAWMAQRPAEAGQAVIPKAAPRSAAPDTKETESRPEDRIFDKAAKAEQVESLRKEVRELEESIEKASEDPGDDKAESRKSSGEALDLRKKDIKAAQSRVELLKRQIEDLQADASEE